MQKVLITGCSGFIGFHLAKRLSSMGIQVVGLDNFNPYYTPRLKRLRASQLDIEIIEGDLQDKELLHALVAKHNFTHVVHLAAQAGVRYSLTHPDTYIDSNIQGFLNVLESIKSTQPKLIFASSSSIYGNNTKIPFSEVDTTESPTSLYGATKKANELMAHSYHHLFQIPMIGLRFFTVYGPYGRPDMAYFSFAEAIMKDTPLTLYDKGTLKRDFTYIDDIIDGIVSCLDYETEFEIFNLGNNTPQSVMELVEILQQHLEKKAILEFKDKPLTEVAETYADISKAKQKLHFNPKTDLKTGLNHFTKWYLNYRN